MKSVATIKLKVKHDKRLLDMSKTFLNAVQYAIDKGFEAKINNRFKLHHFVYRDLRQWLPANFACEAIAKASENLKATKLKKKPIMKSCPISFNRNLFTFSFDKVRIATFTPRQRKEILIDIPEYYWKYLDWRYQTLEIIKDRKERMFFHITFSRDVNIPKPSRSDKVLGVDVGINHVAVTSNRQFFSGSKIKQYRLKFKRLRARLQSKGTRAAQKRLKAISGREKRYKAHWNHVISKQIVDNCDAGTIVLENIKGIRRGRKGRRFNFWLHGWSFYQLQRFIQYKAMQRGIRVIKVNPYHTSQTCSKCGSLGTRSDGFFVCSHCSYSLNADLNASYNLAKHHSTADDVLGAVTHPHIQADEHKASSSGIAYEAMDKSPYL